MKKALAIFLSVLMIATIIVPTFAYADGGVTLVLTADKTQVVKGGSVTVTVTITENPGFNLFGATPNFDKSNFTQNPTNVTYGDIGTGTKGKNASIDSGAEDTTETGFLFSYTIVANETATLGSYTLGLKSIDVANLAEEQLEDITFNTVSVEVIDCPHTNKTDVPAVASTCSTKGHAAYTICDDCGAVVSGSSAELDLDPTNHVYDGDPTPVEAVVGTCTTKAVSAGTKCPACDAILSGCEEGELDPANHVYDGDPTPVEAVVGTCATKAVSAGTKCPACDAILSGCEEGELDPTNHEGETEIRDAVAATCTTAGYSGDTYCKACNTKLSDGHDIQATGHSFGEAGYEWSFFDLSSYPYANIDEAAAAEIPADGKSVSCYGSHTCTTEGCGTTVGEYATVTSQEKTPATCTAKGTTTYTATFGDENGFTTQTKDLEDIPALGHDWGEVTYTWADDNSTCTATRTCTRDASHVETETVDSTSQEKIPATCEGKGTTTYTATFENAAFQTQSKDVEDINATGHVWGEVTYTWSDDGKTCTATRVCGNDASHVETETVNSTSQVKTPATCTAKGTTTYTATFTTNAAFQTQSKDVEDINALGHDLLHHDAQPATCTEIGWEAYDECKREGCDYTTYVEIPATGHDWGEVTYTWADDNSTCTAKRTCGNDSSHVEEEIVTATSEVTTEPTTEAEGVRTYTATFENSAFETQTTTETIDKLATAKADGGEWKDDSKEGLEVEVPEGLTGTPSAVTVTDKDGKETVLEEDDYEFEDGVLTLSSEFLAGLPAGNYTLNFRVDNTVVTATFNTVDVTASPTDGDNASLIVWSMIALISLAGAVVTGTKIKKSTAR